MAPGEPRVMDLPPAVEVANVVCPRYPYPPVGGGVKRSLRLLECLERAGLRIRVLTDDRPGHDAIDALSRRGWEIYVAADRGSSGLRRVQQHLLRLPGPRSLDLAEQLRGSAAAGSLTQLEGVVAAAHATWPHRSPLVFSTHNVERHIARAAAERDRQPMLSWSRRRYHAHRVAHVEARTAQLADAVLCVSDHDAEVFQRDAKRVVIAPNGVDQEFFDVQEPDPESEDVLFFGQFTYEPNRAGLMRFVREGWPLLSTLRPNSRLLIAGEGSAEMVRPASGMDRMPVLGLVDDIAATVAGARVTLVPIWSGGGTRLKVLESLAAMRPVVGTSLGVSGIGFRSGTHGLTAETPDELARAAATLLGQPNRLIAMGQHARSLAQPYLWTRALAPAEALYREYVVGHNRS